jgi:hypothetical protein
MKNIPDETIELNKSQNNEYLIPCIHCHVETSHKVILSIDVNGIYHPHDIQYWEQHQIVQCQGCKSISFRKNFGNSEEGDYIEDPEDGSYEEVYPDHEEIYPSRIAGRGIINKTWYLPPSVLEIYNETHSALSNKLPILAGIGIRTLIEAVCQEKKAAGNNLKERIDSLVGMGTLTQAGCEILHTMRDLGNEAAHNIRPHSDETLRIAMDVVENLLQSVYILPKISQGLKK